MLKTTQETETAPCESCGRLPGTGCSKTCVFREWQMCSVDEMDDLIDALARRLNGTDHNLGIILRRMKEVSSEMQSQLEATPAREPLPRREAILARVVFEMKEFSPPVPPYYSEPIKNVCRHWINKIQSVIDTPSSAPATPAPTKEADAKRVCDAIREVLLNHSLIGWIDQDDDPVRLVDRLSSGESIQSGKDEIDAICDDIYNNVLTIELSDPSAVQTTGEEK